MGSDAAKAVERMRAPSCQAIMAAALTNHRISVSDDVSVPIMFLTSAGSCEIKSREQSANSTGW
jgi:hypothetical protein